VYGSFALALVFAIMPMPEMVSAARPWLLAMLLAYWIMEAPSKVGMGTPS
jgi:rod shape-determining protein MreD